MNPGRLRGKIAGVCITANLLLASSSSVLCSDAQSPGVLTATVERMDIPLGNLETIGISGTDIHVKSYRWEEEGPKRNLLGSLSEFQADGTSHTIHVEGEIWGAYRSGDILRTLEVRTELIKRARPIRSFLVREHNLETGDVRTLVQPAPKGIEGIHFSNEKLYLIARAVSLASPPADGLPLLSVRVVDLPGGEEKTSYTVSAIGLGSQDDCRVGRFHCHEGWVYCYIQTREAPSGIYRHKLGSGNKIEKVVDVSDVKDFCFVPTRPWLAYIHGTPKGPTMYALSMVALDGTSSNPVTAPLDVGKIRFDRFLQYDPFTESFVIRGMVLPITPKNRFYCRITPSHIPK